MNKVLFGGLIASSVFFAEIAMASGQAELLARDGGAGVQERVSVQWDDSHLKMAFPGEEDGFMLARADGVYTIVQSPIGQIVMDVGAMSQMTGEEDPGFTDDYAQSVERFADTGNTRSVAGIEGAVYDVAWTDYQGVSHEAQAVVTDNELVVGLTESMQYLGALDPNKNDALAQTVLSEGLGVLAFGDFYELASIEAANHPGGTFTLPREPMDMQEIMQMMQQMGGGM